MSNTLILGGYGNFGKRISAALVKAGVPVIIAGRSAEKAEALAAELRELSCRRMTASGNTPDPGIRRGDNGSASPPARNDAIQTAAIDITRNLPEQLKVLKPTTVIHTAGPFQGSDYNVAEACIAAGCHYIDLSDAREFVTGITMLDAAAKAAGVSVISGASTVPGLSSAVVEEYQKEFSSIDSLHFGISPGQQAERGLATTQAIMSYVGKPLAPLPTGERLYGWQNLHRQPYPELGKRWMANCDVPDLDLLPQKYGIKSIRFSAGLELAPLHLGLWAMSWLVRAGVPLQLERHAEMLLKASNWFNRFGTSDGGMHIILRGTGLDGKPHERKWFIIARNGDGPNIPTIPAIVLAKKLAAEAFTLGGAMPCLGLVTLEEYLAELEGYAIETYSTVDSF